MIKKNLIIAVLLTFCIAITLFGIYRQAVKDQVIMILGMMLMMMAGST